MAVMTYTRRQVVADLFPEFLTRRAQPFAGAAEEYAREVGTSRGALGFLSGSMALWEDGVLTRVRSRWRSPYVTNEEPRERTWREIVQAGFASDVADGWRITASGRSVADEYQRRFRAHLRGLPVPAEPTQRAASVCSRLATRVPASAERTAIVQQLPHPPAGEPRSDLVTLNRGVTELWSLRDDCHVAAWEAAGYDGPTLDVLTQVWPGRPDLAWATQGGLSSVEQVLKAVGTKQTASGVERVVDQLVQRGDIVRDGDALGITPQGQRSRETIEDETDRRYFAIWDLDDAATARLGEDLRAVIEALPTAA